MCVCLYVYKKVSSVGFHMTPQTILTLAVPPCIPALTPLFLPPLSYSPASVSPHLSKIYIQFQLPSESLPSPTVLGSIHNLYNYMDFNMPISDLKTNIHIFENTYNNCLLGSGLLPSERGLLYLHPIYLHISLLCFLTAE